jgi:glycosyltransferase involved in cell wall biosynthesis
LNLLGAALPDNLLSPNQDNKLGYWESVDVIRLDHAVLEAAGTVWSDDMQIPDEWFSSEAACPFLERGAALLRAAIQQPGPLALKDPRLCRLLPFWNHILDQLGLRAHYILILRSPVEVFSSLQSRGRKAGFETMAITQREKSDLLWLRYVLEAERRTRKSRRSILTYDALLANPLECLTRILHEAGMDPSDVQAGAGAALSESVSPALRRHANRDEELGANSLVSEMYGLFDQHVRQGRSLDTDSLDRVYDALNAVSNAYAPLRAMRQLHTLKHSRWPVEILAQVFLRTRRPAYRPARVIYVSGLPDTPSHRYRVVHQIEALADEGIEASWMPVERASEADIRAGDVVIIFRVPWSPAIEELRARCAALRVPVGFDVDDLLFEPDVMSKKHPGLHQLFSAGGRRTWLEECEKYQRLMKAVDFGLFPTQALAVAAAKYMSQVYVLPNGIGREMSRRAECAESGKEGNTSRGNGVVRIGFVSGTFSSRSNFRVVAMVLERLLSVRTNVVLTVVGPFQIGEFPSLRRHASRVEVRASVEQLALLDEYARFDINVAPFDSGNAFFEAKSPHKYFEAALVGVPTIVSPTPSYQSAICDRETGRFAGTAEDWYAALTNLIDDAAERQRLGRNARVHAWAAFGPELRRALLMGILGTVAATHAPPAN